MKVLRLAIFAILFCALSASVASAQSPMRVSPDCVIGIDVTASGAGAAYDNRRDGCVNWHLYYTNFGFSALSIEVDNAPDSDGAAGSMTVWPTAQVGTVTAWPMTATTQGAASMQGFFPWVRYNITTVTGTGKIKGLLIGYRPSALEDINLLPGTVSLGTGDPCANPNFVKSTFAISQTANTQIVGLVAGQTIYVCGMVLIATSGTTPTAQFASSSTAGSACATAPSLRTGVMTPSVGAVISAGFGGSTLFATNAPSQVLCIMISGTTPVWAGWISYIQR